MCTDCVKSGIAARLPTDSHLIILNGRYAA